jgi:hypothetical protein
MQLCAELATRYLLLQEESFPLQPDISAVKLLLNMISRKFSISYR